MRLWSLHPRLLDSIGLVALWRETLLAQAVLAGRTSGYRHHPQLLRFKRSSDPLGAIGRYLFVVKREADRRGYSFDGTKIDVVRDDISISVTSGQVRYEAGHLLAKLRRRDPGRHAAMAIKKRFAVSPVFRVVRGLIEPWEVVAATVPRRPRR